MMQDLKDLKGKYIVFEGIDGSGKTTQANIFADMLEACHGLEVVRVSEPGSTSIALRIREILKTPTKEIFDPITEMLLFFAARRQSYVNIVKPALERGAVVVSDRGMHSTYAYQGFGRNLGIDLIEQLQDITFGSDFEYDYTVFIDLDPVVAKARTAKRAGEKCRLDASSLEFFSRSVTGYKAILDKNLLEPENFIMDGSKGTYEIARGIEDYFYRSLHVESEGHHPVGGGCSPVYRVSDESGGDDSGDGQRPPTTH